MKKLLSILLGVFLCIQAFAQVNVNGGYLNSTFRSHESGYSYNVNGNGFYVGASTDIALPYQYLYFSPGLNFDLVDYNFGEGVDVVEYFLTAPLHVKYVHPFSNVGDLFVSGGPSLLCTLGGKSRYSYGGASYTENEKGGDFDIILGLEGGILLSNNLKLMLGYDFGLLNQSGDNDYKVTRNYLHIGLGYVF